MTTSQFDIKRTRLDDSPFDESIGALKKYLIQLGFKLSIFRYDQHARIVHQFNKDSFEVTLSVSEQGENPALVISKNGDSFFIEEFIYYNELAKTYHELVSKNLELENYILMTLEFIKNEIMTLNSNYDFSMILSSNDFEAIIDKFLTPFLIGVGFSVDREKNTDCGDDSFIFTLGNIALNLTSAGRLGNGSIVFEIHEGSNNKIYSYSELQRRLSLPDDVSRDIARWEGGFYGGNYYRVISTIKDTVKPILSYLQSR